MTLGAMFQDAKFDFTHLNCVGKTAIVGDSEAQQVLVKAFNFVFPKPIKFFAENDITAATQWLATA